ncbi:MAG: type II toxin-antitoxin system VapC family toxin [Akkermansiaceae bacterium]|jgi:predicted nucleic acid-binding protein|nr:type II toxin-antitoxin system VapC family toxin [Akkermansiaceae bacterium]
MKRAQSPKDDQWRSPCLDSSAWIEIAHQGPNARRFLQAAGDFTQVIVSTITLYEVWKYTAINADETRAQQIVDLLQQGIVIAPDTAISLSAANLSVRHKTAMADSLIYATALAHKATLWTQDDDFENLPHVKYFPKIKA